LLALMGLVLATPATAQTLQLQKQVIGSTTVPSGQAFTYRLLYNCLSTTAPCVQAKIEDVLPPELSGLAAYVALTGSGQTTSATYNATTRTATWTFVNPLPAGSTGEVTLTVRFPTGTTPNGTTTTNSATFSAKNAASVTATAPVVTATATAQATLDKTLRTATSVGGDYTYWLTLATPATNSLSYESVVVTDQLPVGAVYVSSSGGGTYNAGTHTVTWPAFDMGTSTSIVRTLTLNYPISLFTAGQSVTNTATAVGTPLGGTPQTLTDNVTHTLAASACNVSTSFTPISPSEVVVGHSGGFRIRVRNIGNVPLTGYRVTQNIPAQMNATSITVNGAVLPVRLEYTTNLNPSFQTSGDYTTNTIVQVSSLGLGAGEYVTAIRYTFLAPVPAGFDSSGYGFDGTVISPDRNGNPVATPSTISVAGSYAVSCGSGGGGGGGAEVPVSGSVAVVPPSSYYYLNKAITPGSTSVSPNGTLNYRLRVQNQAYATDNLLNPSIADLLDARFTYVDGSASPTPTEVIPNYNGTGRTLLRWNLNTSLAPGAYTDITLQVRADADAAPGTVPNTFYATGASNPRPAGAGTVPDVNDLDRDGNTTEAIYPSNTVNATMLSYAQLESSKGVKGSLDAGYSHYPAVGQTVPGGLADYRLVVRNTGNVSMANIKVLDILPFIGDTGVLTDAPRESAWRPNLVGPISAPAGVTVYYSTETNPCRTDLGVTGPAGCTGPTWSTTPPADITAVQSLRFDYASTLAPADSLVLMWPMRAPYGTPSGQVAWNSFAFSGSRTDGNGDLLPSEPSKVGIEVGPPQPADYGNFIWEDLNHNGIQEAGEPGINGVRVELYNVGPDGQYGTSDDYLATDRSGNVIPFTLTGNDQNGQPGYYVFPYLQPGTYVAKVFPPAGYAVTTPNAGGNDEVDSDLDPATNLIGPRTLVSNQLDYTNDAGLYRPASIGDFVWRDLNGNGIQDSGEPGVQGVTVTLYNAAGNAVATTTTDVNGAYVFTGVAPGTYTVGFSNLPAGFGFTTANAGGDDTKDSDANASGRTDAFTLVAGQTNTTIDAGLAAVAVTADLSLTKSVSDPTPRVNDVVTYTVRVTNSGPAAATNVVVEDRLPSGLAFVAFTGGTPGTVNAQTLTWTIPTLASGQTATFTFTARVTAAGSYENVAEVTRSDQDDPDSTPGNNNPNEDDQDGAPITTTGTSGGGNGGVESEGSMASVLARRLYLRHESIQAREALMAAPTPVPFESVGKVAGLREVLPATGPQATPAFEVSPTDLIGVTNATSVAAVDYLRPDGRRVGAIFGATSPQGTLYDHAKASCDRLGGGRLDYVRTVTIDGRSFVLSKLVQASGEVDYAVSLVAYRTAGGFVVDSRFGAQQYASAPEGTQEVYNIQAWTVSPDYTAELVSSVLARLGEQGAVTFRNGSSTAVVPSVYVVDGRYEGGEIRLRLRNTTGRAVDVPMTGLLTKTEGEAAQRTRADFAKTLSVAAATADAPLSEVVVPVGSLFDGAFRLDASVSGDEFYFADGSWGTYVGASAQVSSFATQPESRTSEEGVYLVERDAQVAGTVKDYVSLFRYLRPAGAPVNLTGYDAMSFTYRSSVPVQVMVDKASTTSWSGKFATNLPANPSGRTVSIPFASLAPVGGEAGRFAADDVTMVAFYALGNGSSNQSFTLGVENLRFVSAGVDPGETTATELSISGARPNPFHTQTSLQIALPESGYARVSVYDAMGRRVATLLDREVSAGTTSVTFVGTDLASGMYLVRLETAQGTRTRMVVLSR